MAVSSIGSDTALTPPADPGAKRFGSSNDQLPAGEFASLLTRLASVLVPSAGGTLDRPLAAQTSAIPAPASPPKASTASDTVSGAHSHIHVANGDTPPVQGDRPTKIPPR